MLGPRVWHGAQPLSLQKPGPPGKRQAAGRGTHAALPLGIAPGLGQSPHKQSPEGPPPLLGQTSMGPCGHAGAAVGAGTLAVAPSSWGGTEHPLPFPDGPHLQHQQPGPLPAHGGHFTLPSWTQNPCTQGDFAWLPPTVTGCHPPAQPMLAARGLSGQPGCVTLLTRRKPCPFDLVGLCQLQLSPSLCAQE